MNAHPTDWTFSTLYAHLNRLIVESDRRYSERFDAQEKATEWALASAKLAVDKAEAEAAEWRRGSNEWRNAMADKDARFLTRVESDARFLARDTRTDGIDKRLNDLEDWRSGLIGKSSGLNAGWGYLLGVAGLVSLIVGLVLALKGG